MTAAVLRVSGLTKRFPGVLALDDVSLEVRPREVVGLVGENGAGKSSLLKILAGIHPPDRGTIMLRDRPVAFRSVAEAADAGIGMVFQEQSLLTNVSVAENILLGHEGAGVRHGLYRWQTLNARAAAQLAKLDARIAPDTPTGALSFAERQVVELAKVLAIEERTRHEPVILLDEPTSVLDAAEVETVLALIERLRARASVIFVSHRLDEVLRVSDRVYVMTNGRCVAERDPRHCDVAELQALMLGRALSSEYDQQGAPAQDRDRATCLAVRDLGRSGHYRGITFDLEAGEVLGVAGVQGSGRESLCRTLFGAEAPDTGTITLDGRPARFRSPADAVRAGIGYVPAERRVEGIIGGLTVRDNMTLPHLGRLSRGPVVDPRRELDLVTSWITRLRIKTPSPATPAGNLSGGNQQKVVLAKWLIAGQPRLLILDHPLRGLDVGAKAEIIAVIRELAANGIGILLIADTLEELIALSHTIIVMKDGTITGRFPTAPARPTQLQILERMV